MNPDELQPGQRVQREGVTYVVHWNDAVHYYLVLIRPGDPTRQRRVPWDEFYPRGYTLLPSPH